MPAPPTWAPHKPRWETQRKPGPLPGAGRWAAGDTAEPPAVSAPDRRSSRDHHARFGLCNRRDDPYGCPMSSWRPPFRRTRVGPSALPEHVCPGQGTCSSDVVVEGELVGVGAQAQGVDLAGALVRDPRLEQIVGEDVAGAQEVVVGLERVERGLQRDRK